MLYRLEHHRSPKGLILRESSCQILYWWPTYDLVFQLRTPFLVAHPNSETVLRLPGSFAAPVMRGGGQATENWGWEKAKNWNRAMREAVKAVQREWKEWKMVDLSPGTWCSCPSCSLLSRNYHLWHLPDPSWMQQGITVIVVATVTAVAATIIIINKNYLSYFILGCTQVESHCGAFWGPSM